MKTITHGEIESMDKLARVQFANSLPGPKPVSLIGTIDAERRTISPPFPPSPTSAPTPP